ncbi:MAG: aryl-sulfate sulfotransferase [Vicinamibacteria bacterium]
MKVLGAVTTLLATLLLLAGCEPSGHGPEGTDGRGTNGHVTNGQGTKGHATNGHDAGGDEGERGLPRNDGPRGLIRNEPGATPGYVLFAPILSDTTYLIDQEGQVVHTWKGEYAPAASVYFLDNGNLLRTAREPDVEAFTGGGQGGRIRELTWESELAWDFLHSTDEYLTHHDVELLPNGNILAIAWERKTVEEARRAGRRPDLLPEKGLWPDMVLELEPTRPEGARIVWEWHMWDHLVQNHDPEADNYGDPAARPGRIDSNGDGDEPEISQEELEQLQALGYVPADADVEDVRPDLLHTNAVAYNAALDQIALSVPRFNEIWIIDHSTTSEEAAGSTGGRYGRGGDLLYRWGNPRAYGRGGKADQGLFAQHDVRWIPDGLPGAGHLMMFSNDVPRVWPPESKEDEDNPANHYSAVLEIVPPLNGAGGYERLEDGPFGPAEPLWSYESYHSPFISGAQRLENGNTLVTAGPQGRFFEVTRPGEIVWEYGTPYSGYVTNSDGSFPHPVGEATYAVFRATKIPPDHPALAERDLKPLDPQPEILPPPKPPEEPEAEDDEEEDKDAGA